MTPTILDPAAELHACLDRAGAIDPDRLGADGQAALLQSIARAEARLVAWKLKVIAAADRSRTAAQSGAASTGQWAARLSNVDQACAHREVSLAQGLDRRTATQNALARGEISPAHAEVIVRADSQLPTGTEAEQRGTIEIALIAKAQNLSPSALRRAARRALEAVEKDVAFVDAHENEVVRDAEEVARAKTRLTLHDNGDGTVTGHFTVPVVQGHLLRKILETMTAPRRSRLGATQAQGGQSELRTDWDRARGDAFAELIEHLPTDHLHPIHFKSCAADGCERPLAWCELHHLTAWLHGGRTDLGDAVPLCHFHHQRIHDHHYRHARLPDGTFTFHRRA